MIRPILTASGLFVPPHRITNEELVACFNAWADADNAAHADVIARGERAPQPHSSVAFIEKASGIRSRYVMDRDGILDPERMVPSLPERPDEALSILAEMAVAAGRDALSRAGRDPRDVDAVICAASNMQRPYPAMAIEVQDALGAGGFAFDMNVACSSATFGIQTAASFVETGRARSVLVVNPEICTGHLNFRDRDSHFIFGDVATATLIESPERAGSGWEILGTKLKTRFSNNIRNNFGFLNRCAPERADAPDKLFVQQGKRVFKQVIPLVADVIREHLRDLDLTPEDISRAWLHQANVHMNRLIAAAVVGRDVPPDWAPVVLDRFANTSSAGSIIAFHEHHDDLPGGAIGLLCSFGAGYSCGTVLLRRR